METLWKLHARRLTARLCLGFELIEKRDSMKIDHIWTLPVMENPALQKRPYASAAKGSV